ncbi:M48 family metallopeptidase [Flammeovirga sp. MY04]|uniref:M48 family metallopeptidase n=1 Tax=Flammeovirga sp. MY04 TaxID=1191459 RepID=UPI00080610CF|nr:M48 family metallopeptidase [Flammeovirga sp. MY04]ANQ50421.1 M48 family metallopeptidase [Flammeovirga sp. MY04]
MPTITNKTNSTSYKAILIHPQLPTGRQQGDVRFGSQKVDIQAGDFYYAIPFAELEIEAGGASGQFIFFKSRKEKDISFYTKDKSILKDDFLISDPRFREHIKKTKFALTNLYRGAALFLSVCLIIITSFYLFKDSIVKMAARNVPISWEEQMGDELFESIKKEYTFIENDSLIGVLGNELQPLINQVEAEGFHIELYLVEDASINAFALPGGKVMINSGLIKNASSWDEVAGVMAHEISHVSLRHHVRGAIDKIGFFSVVYLFLGDGSAVMATLANTMFELQTTAYSRTLEQEADSQGINYLQQSRINPEGMIQFFEMLDEKHEMTQIDSLLQFVSTHPSTPDRINDLKEQIEDKKENNYISFQSNYDDFKEGVLLTTN